MSAISYIFEVKPLNCKKCEQKIKEALTQETSPYQFLSIETNIKNKSLRLVLDIAVNEADLRAWLARVLADKQVVSLQTKQASSSHLSSAVIALILGLFYLCLPYLALPMLPMIFVGAGLMVWNAWPFIQSAWLQFQMQPRLNMDSLFVLTAAIIILSSLASLWSPLFSISLEAGFFIFGFRHLGLEFINYLDQKMGLSQSMVERFRERVYLLSDGRAKKAEELVLGDHVILQAGDILPVDAKLESMSSGASLVDHVDNGAYFPKELKQGQTIEAGSMLESGQLNLVVEKTLYQSRLQHIDEVVTRFQVKNRKAEILQKTQAWLQWFIPGLVLVAISSGLVLAQIYSLSFALQAVTSILVSACPCTLGLIIPMAMRMGAYKASQHHLHFKSSKSLELAAAAQIIVLDYNGSLTEGEYELKDYEEHAVDAKALIKAFETEMLRQNPGQLIGQTIADYVKTEEGLELKNFAWCQGGVTAQTASGKWWFGHSELLRNLGLNQAEPKPQHYYLVFQALGETDKKIVAQFMMQDKLRPGVKDLVQDLKIKGKMVRICTGADVSSAELIMQALGVERHELKTNCLLDKKPEYIQELRQTYPGKCIAMLGDGLNDKAALEAVDLKIWVRHPRLATSFQAAMQDIADLELNGQDIQYLGLAFAIAQQTYGLIQQNLIFSFAYNFLILSLACGIICMLPPALGVCLMILQSALLSLNTYRVLLKPLPEGKKLAKMQDNLLHPQIS